jgi:hypothetical protein
MKSIVIVCLALIGLFVVSCEKKGDYFGTSLTEGRIDYAVTFPHLDPDNVMMSILPDQMTISFKGDRYNSEFNTYGGVFKNKISIDTKGRSYTQMLKIFKKRLSCKYDQIDLEEMMQDFPPFTIIKSDRIDTIAGIPCRMAKGIFYAMDEPDINIYYSDQIAVKDPNWCSPFAELDGFLLGYDIDMFDMRLRLLAENVEAAPIEDEEFLVEEDYKKVSYKYIKVELEKLMESFDI